MFSKRLYQSLQKEQNFKSFLVEIRGKCFVFVFFFFCLNMFYVSLT